MIFVKVCDYHFLLISSADRSFYSIPLGKNVSLQLKTDASGDQATKSVQFLTDKNIKVCAGNPFALFIQWKTVSLCDLAIQIWATSWQNQQNDLCAQRRLRLAWASDQSLRCALTG